MSIRELRAKEGLSQAAFAAKYNIPKRTLQEWEQGRSKPPIYIETMLGSLSEFKALPYKKIPSPKKKSWKLCASEPFLSYEKIYPIQQRKVLEIINLAKANPDISSVIIFGSSVTDKCHVGSDVDVYIEAQKDISTLPVDFDYDLLTNFSADEKMKKEIFEKGVRVYERRKNSVR